MNSELANKTPSRRMISRSCEKYISGIKLFELPIEEILFFIVVPYACLFIYACMKYYFPKAENFKWTKSVWLIVAIFSAGMVAFYYEQIYTLVTFSLLVLSTKKPNNVYFFDYNFSSFVKSRKPSLHL